MELRRFCDSRTAANFISKKKDLAKFLPLISTEAKEFYCQFIDDPVQDILDDVDMMSEQEEEID